MQTKTENRLFEMMTENTGTHFLDSGMNDGRHWQQNQKLSESDFYNRPPATLSTEYGTYAELDLFHFLRARVELSPLAETLQSDFETYVNDSPELSFYDCEAMETFAQFVQGGNQPETLNSYNWENLLSQVIQYVPFECAGRFFVLLQIHGGADVRGGYTRPQVFEVKSEYAFYDMQDVGIECTNSDCEYSLDIRGGDVLNIHGSTEMTSSEFYELKACPECGGELCAYAPQPSIY